MRHGDRSGEVVRVTLVEKEAACETPHLERSFSYASIAAKAAAGIRLGLFNTAPRRASVVRDHQARSQRKRSDPKVPNTMIMATRIPVGNSRSEERRVGKGGRGTLKRGRTRDK